MEEIALLNTVLLRWDGARIYAPNSRLNSEQLFNLSRSASKSEVLKVRAAGSQPEAGLPQAAPRDWSHSALLTAAWLLQRLHTACMRSA